VGYVAATIGQNLGASLGAKNSAKVGALAGKAAGKAIDLGSKISGGKYADFLQGNREHLVGMATRVGAEKAPEIGGTVGMYAANAAAEDVRKMRQQGSSGPMYGNSEMY
jgi:hypothetical protein